MIYLLQRGTIRRPLINSFLSAAVELDAMDYAEYEYGAKAKSLRALEAASSQLQTVLFPEVRRHDGRALMGYGVIFDERRTALAKDLVLLSGDKLDTHDWTNFPQAVSPLTRMPLYVRTKTERQVYLQRLTNFWWDLENHVMLSFEEDFMNVLPQVLQHSWDKMNADKAAREAA